MRKQVFGRHLKRDTHERKALFRGLASSLIMHERIETTEEKAKAIKGFVEKLVTKAKKNNSQQAQRLLQGDLNHEAMQKMLSDIAPRFVDRQGGYTRIVRIGQRFSDNASMVLIEWVEKSTNGKVQAASLQKRPKTGSDQVEAEAKAVTDKAGAKKSSTKKETKTTEKKSTKKVAAKKTVKKEGSK